MYEGVVVVGSKYEVRESGKVFHRLVEVVTK